jgi:hypothetical protein
MTAVEQNPTSTPPHPMSFLTRLRRRAPIIAVAMMPFMLNSCITPDLMNAQAGALGALGRTGGAGAQNRFMNDQANTVNQGTAVGAGAGMIAAAALGRRLGPLGALAVVAGGALIGNAFGRHVAMKKALAVQSSANLDAAIAEAKSDNASASKNLSSLRSQLAALKKRAAAAKASGNSNELSMVKADMRKLQATVNSGRKSLDTAVQNQTALSGKLNSSNAKYASIRSGLATTTSTRAGYDSLSKEIGSALNEF